MSRVLLIEDDRAVREGVALALRRRSQAAQLICTVLAAQGVADQGAAPASATVQDAAGHDLGATGRSCQAG